MSRQKTAIIIILTLFLLGITSTILINKKRNAVRQSSPEKARYYEDLTRQCENQGSGSCCRLSLEYMQENGYTSVDSNSTCQEGYFKNTLKCPDSHHWCEKEKSTKIKPSSDN